MSGATRYERVPQVDDNISLVSLGNYNYMTGVPNSPPPSFHSSQSVGDPNEVTPTHTTPTTQPIDQQRSLAPSVMDSTTDSEAVVINLHKRIEQLEETIGRLLLEKESGIEIPTHNSRTGSNCCVTFANGDPSAAELAAISGENNCCVTFGPKRQRSERDRRIGRILAVVFSVLCLVAFWTILLAAIKSNSRCKMPEDVNMDGPE